MTKTLKSTLAVLLAIVLLISAMPITASAAASDMKITVSTKNAMAGQTVEIDVAVSNNPGVAAISLDIDYDKDNLTLLGFTYNDLALSGASTTPYNASASIPCLFMVNGTQNITGDFVFATLTFEVKADAQENIAAPITLSYDPDNIYDITEENIDCEIVNGAVNIISCIPGDINGDEKVNSKDVSRLMQYHAHWDVEVNEPALDTNGDGKHNSKDVTRLMQYLAHWDVVLYPVVGDEPSQGLKAVSAKAPSCEEAGNIAYWYDANSNKYYKDAAGIQEITLEETVIKALGHSPVTVAGYAPTTESAGLTDGVQCSVCHEWLQEQTVIPKLSANEYSITYNIYGNDSYLQSRDIENANPRTYTSESGISAFAPLEVPGYTFEGWYDAPGNNGIEVRSIPVGSTGNKTLYARWSQETYNITYKLYQTPLEAISDSRYLTYTTGKGLADLPNPTLYNYIFLGWYTDKGKEVTSIPAGTVGDITLNAYWTSKRNLNKRAGKDEKPIILENYDEGIIYFAYEIGTIENVPLTDAIWTIQAVSGLAQQKSVTVTTQITEQNASTVSNTISNSTVDSGTWTLSENWNENTSVSESWAEQNGLTQEEANTITKTSSNTYSFTSGSGGSESQVDNTGTSTLGYNSQNYEHGNGVELSAKAHYNASLEAKGDIGVASATAKAEYGVEIGGKYSQQQKTNEHTGTDTTTLDTHTHTGTSTWNSSSTASSTMSASESSSYKQAISQVVTNTKGYGKSYSSGGGSSETQGHSSTDSESISSSSTLSYSKAQITTTTSTYSTDGKSEGCYRLVIAGTIHVFGVVGYVIGSESYFATTYSVMDDRTYEFLDYAPDLSFSDYENGCLPFEVPDDIYNYVNSTVACTEGLVFRTNSANGTAILNSYNGTDTDVKVPTYITSNGRAYKVTGISSTAFAGKPIKNIILGRYIEEIPDNAFKDCAQLEGVSGKLSKIGANAFSGCVSLRGFTLPGSITSIGENAFTNVPELTVNVIGLTNAKGIMKDEYPQEDDESDEDYAARINEIANVYAAETAKSIVAEAVSSGARNVTINLGDTVSGVSYDIAVPEIDSITINGGRKNYSNFTMKSYAEKTSLCDMTIQNTAGIPLELHSAVLELNAVSITAPSFCMLLAEDGVNVNLKRDSIVISEGGKAIVCKNPSFVSLIDSNGSIMTDGVIDIYGNIYVCGNITGSENFTVQDGTIVSISEAEFEDYIKGIFKVTFDPNGGTTETTEKELVFGSSYGELPTPARDGFTFIGWYLAGTDTQITSDIVPEDASDVTLRARWLSDWTVVDDVPVNTVVDSQQWSYTLRKYSESGNSEKDGWVKYDTKVTSYEAEKGPVYSNPSGNDRKVRSESYKIRDNYKTVWHYSRSVSGTSGWNNWAVNVSPYTDYLASGPQSITLDYQLGRRSQNDVNGLPAYGNYTIGGWDCPVWYNEWSESVYVNSDYGTRWYYQEPIYTFYFYRDLDEVAESDPTGQTNVSNVQKWVKYIEK